MGPPHAARLMVRLALELLVAIVLINRLPAQPARRGDHPARLRPAPAAITPRAALGL